MSPSSGVDNDYVLTDPSSDHDVPRGTDYVTSGSIVTGQPEASDLAGHIITASGDMYANVDKRHVESCDTQDETSLVENAEYASVNTARDSQDDTSLVENFEYDIFH